MKTTLINLSCLRNKNYRLYLFHDHPIFFKFYFISFAFFLIFFACLSTVTKQAIELVEAIRWWRNLRSWSHLDFALVIVKLLMCSAFSCVRSQIHKTLAN